MNINLRSFSRINASLLFVALFGAFTGVIGFVYGQASKNLSDHLSDSVKQIMSFIGSPAFILGFLTLVNSTISKEIEAKAEDKLKADLDTEISKFIDQYREDTKDLKNAIESLASSEEGDRLREIILSIENSGKKFKVSREATEKIAEWLAIIKNKSSLLNAALEAVSKANINIPQEYTDNFKQDIRQCINWLYDSVLHGTGCQVEPKKQASAIANLPKKHESYEIALKAIQQYLEDQQELEPYYSKTSVVEKVVDYLIQELGKLSKQIK